MAEDLSTIHRRVLTQSEATYGTDAIDLANNLAVDRVYHSLDELAITGNVNLKERPVTRGSAARVEHVMLRENMSVSASGAITAAEAAGGAGTEAPLFRDFLLAMGLSETIVASTSATYARSTTWTSGLSMYDYMRHLDDYLWRLVVATGVRGNGTWSLEAGEIGTWAFEGQSNNFDEDSATTADPHMYSEDLAFFDAAGLIDLDKEGSAIVYTGAEIYDETAVMCVESMTLTVDAEDFAIQSMTGDLGWSVVPRRRTRATPVIEEVVLLDDGGVKLGIVLDDSGTDFAKAIRMALDANAVSASAVLTDGTGSGGSTLTMTYPKVQFDWVALRDDSGLATWEIPAFANGDYGASILGDNELSWAWSVTP